jgi:hypothetical protein
MYMRFVAPVALRNLFALPKQRAPQIELRTRPPTLRRPSPTPGPVAPGVVQQTLFNERAESTGLHIVAPQLLRCRKQIPLRIAPDLRRYPQLSHALLPFPQLMSGDGRVPHANHDAAWGTQMRLACPALPASEQIVDHSHKQCLSCNRHEQTDDPI